MRHTHPLTFIRGRALLIAAGIAMAVAAWGSAWLMFVGFELIRGAF